MDIEKFLALKSQFAKDIELIIRLHEILNRSNYCSSFHTQIEIILEHFSEVRTNYYIEKGLTFDIDTIAMLIDSVKV